MACLPDAPTDTTRCFEPLPVTFTRPSSATSLTFIAINFLENDKICCCPGRSVDPAVGLTEISVRELESMGLGHLAVGDLNNDGMLDTDDLNAFMAGARPKTRLQDRR